LDDQDEDSLIEKVMAHLESASRLMQEQIGSNALKQISGSDLSALDETLKRKLKASLGPDFDDFAGKGPVDSLPEALRDRIREALGIIGISEGYRRLLLGVGDRLWVEYLTEMEALRTSIGLEAYGQRDPLVQYKSRAVDMFRQLLGSIRAGVVSRMFGVQPRIPQVVAAQAARQQEPVAAAGNGSTDTDGAKPKPKRKRRRRRRR
jgi:preprotein translocase subunit SecA